MESRKVTRLSDAKKGVKKTALKISEVQKKSRLPTFELWDNREKYVKFLVSQGIESKVYVSMVKNFCLCKKRDITKDEFHPVRIYVESVIGEFLEESQGDSILFLPVHLKAS